MKLHPLILSTHDVQATIEGRKTRHSLPAPVPNHDHFGTNIMDWGLSEYPYQKDGEWWFNMQTEADDYKTFKLKSPFGSPGDQEWQTGMPPEDGMYWVEDHEVPFYFHKGQKVDGRSHRWKRMGGVLYVQETYRKYYHVDESGYTQFDKEIIQFAADKPAPINQCDGDGFQMFNKDGSEKFIPWRSPATMPREASRIFLEVTDVTCKRVQSITEEEAKAEGMIVTPEQALSNEGHRARLGNKIPAGDYQLAFANYWNERYFTSISDQLKGNSAWYRNGWVFSCNFKVLSITGKPSFIK
jgi:hypothetical protein